ncbi:MAG: ferrous iron transport protein A [Campylobacterales bacterium]|nr:ferrous iron transport protein A [Campylobacterales bacterium]
MILTELKKGQSATIIKVDAPQALKDRLKSMGVCKGELLTVRGCSLAKQTMEIEIEGTLVALRAEEAQKIEVEKE